MDHTLLRIFCGTSPVFPWHTQVFLSLQGTCRPFHPQGPSAAPWHAAEKPDGRFFFDAAADKHPNKSPWKSKGWNHPWDERYVYLAELGSFVGKYTIPMDAMGSIFFTPRKISGRNLQITDPFRKENDLNQTSMIMFHGDSSGV